jgi:tetratricopeptide (TPR) repeat protein
MRPHIALAAALALAVTACQHTPTQRDRDIAQAKYRVAVELVHEASSAGVENDGTRQRAKYRDALEELMGAAEKNPDDSDVRYLLGFVYFTGFKRHEEAQEHLLAALTLRENDFPEADNLLGSVLVDAGRPADSLEHFDRARKNLLYKTPYFAEQELGWAKYKLGRYGEAAAHMEAAISAQPDLCGGYVKLAEVYEADSKPEQVQDVLDRFVGHCDTERLRPSCGPSLLAHAYYRLGMARLKTGLRDQAADALRQCADRFGEVPVVRECRKSLKLVQ